MAFDEERHHDNESDSTEANENAFENEIKGRQSVSVMGGTLAELVSAPAAASALVLDPNMSDSSFPLPAPFTIQTKRMNSKQRKKARELHNSL